MITNPTVQCVVIHASDITWPVHSWMTLYNLETSVHRLVGSRASQMANHTAAEGGRGEGGEGEGATCIDT